MKDFKLKYKPYGEHSILIEWPQNIDENILFDVLNFKKEIQKYYDKQKVEIKSAYCSMLISYHSTINKIYNEISNLKTLYDTRNDLKKSADRLWKIPVCYADKFGWDLSAISESKNLSKKKIIECHSDTIYRVYFIGFLPGFLYLGGLDEKLHMPRKATPRMMVKKGAVGIGGNQTAIYPNESPGGWNIIGNSPINFFNAKSETPCFAKAGDKISFYSISLDEYVNIQKLSDTGIYQLESEVIDD